MRVLTDDRPDANGEVIDIVDTEHDGPVPAGSHQAPQFSIDDLPF